MCACLSNPPSHAANTPPRTAVGNIQQRLGQWLHSFVGGVSQDVMKLAGEKLNERFAPFSERVMLNAARADQLTAWNEQAYAMLRSQS